MAKGKSSGVKYISKGLHSNVNPRLVNSIRKDRTDMDKMVNLVASWKRGQNPWITVVNTDTTNEFGVRGKTNTPYKKVRADDLWGSPRKRYQMKKEIQEGETE